MYDDGDGDAADHQGDEGQEETDDFFSQQLHLWQRQWKTRLLDLFGRCSHVITRANDSFTPQTITIGLHFYSLKMSFNRGNCDHLSRCKDETGAMGNKNKVIMCSREVTSLVYRPLQCLEARVRSSDAASEESFVQEKVNVEFP